MSRLLLRDVEVNGARQNVAIADGRVVAIGRDLPVEGTVMEGRGGALLPGLTDHHVHLLATAAVTDSIDLTDCTDLADVAARIACLAAARTPGAWLRATACPSHVAEQLTCDVLDRIAPLQPLRVLDRTGALWVLNGAALAAVGDIEPLERDAQGRATGRLWRADAALRAVLGDTPPPLAPIGARLASYGVTAVTDASVTMDATTAALLAGAIPQRLTLMSGGPLAVPPSGGFAIGAVKIVPDERNPPSLEAFVARIAEARHWARAVAVHCVTALELALTLAAFEAAGARPGDRIEHGGVIPAEAIGVIADLGLTVVTQSGFVHARGDRWRRDVDPAEQEDLYRCASLIAGGIPVLGSSDAPYGPLDPWIAMRAAVTRRTATGVLLGADERIAPTAALGLYGGIGRVRIGAVADLCLLRVPLETALLELDSAHVVGTWIAGVPAYLSN